MKRIALHTLGCKLNYTETAEIGRQFIENDYKLVGIDEPADVVVINSCCVTAHAERDCRQIIRRVLRKSPEAFVAVIGCYAQLQQAEIAGIKGVDLVLGSKEKKSVFSLVHNTAKKQQPDIYVSDIEDCKEFELASSAGFDGRTRAFIKIQDGCDYQCAYCTIPLARGKSRSTAISEISRQAREAADLGYKEIVLTGVNIGRYSDGDNSGLLNLLKCLEAVDSIERIRISSIEPNLLSDKLLDFWIGSKKICRHWHIPLQSGSDDVLRLMKRRYVTELFKERVEKIASSSPDAGIGTDVIVGFPGETEELFDITYRFLSKLPLSYLHVFSYSERSGTAAAGYMQKVDPRLITERSRMLRKLSRQKKTAFYRNFTGKTVSVLFESNEQNGILSGLTEEYIRVDVETKLNLINRIVPVRIDDVLNDRCRGIIEKEEKLSFVNIAV